MQIGKLLVRGGAPALVVVLLLLTAWVVRTPTPALPDLQTAAVEPDVPAVETIAEIPFDAATELAPALDAAAELPRLHSLLVSWRGDLVLEHYFNGATPERLANIKSASKSVLSALVGIAIDRGFIESVQQPIGDFFPELVADGVDPRKRTITIEDLLTMRSGLESTSNNNYGPWVVSRNWVQHALNRPLRNDPGARMDYSTGNSHLLSAILTKATGKSTFEFAQETLARPLGFNLARWPQDPQGIYFGGNDMLMTPRQMLAFGEMFLSGGKVDDEEVVPAAWVHTSIEPAVQSPRERGRFYGYSWWVRQLAGHRAHYAWGYGGQFIFLVPSLDLVAVVTSASDVSNERRQHLRTVYDVVSEFVIAPIAASRQPRTMDR